MDGSRRDARDVIELQLQALRIVLAVLRGRSLTATLEQRAVTPGTGAHSAAVQDLAYGVLRHLGTLRAVLARLLAKPLHDDDLEALLLVALYQLQYSRSAPYAVVDHAVQACAHLRKSSARGLINGVLRNFLRQPDTALALARKTETGRWSYPQWWIDRLRDAYPGHYAGILEAGNARPPMTLRVNLRRIARDSYQAMLRAAGLEAHAIGECALVLARPIPVDALPGFSQGLVSVQDLSAQYAAALLDLSDGMRVLDACAAPGGKSAHILERAQVRLTAIDRDAQRLSRVASTFERLGLSGHLLCADASKPAGWWDGEAFDRILLDAPCTASGIVRRHPDIKWLRRPEDLQARALDQRHLLEALWRALAGGGKLLYATCSVFPEENQVQVSAFLEAHSEARLLPLSGIWEAPETENITGQILPDPWHDGFYYAPLQKA